MTWFKPVELACWALTTDMDRIVKKMIAEASPEIREEVNRRLQQDEIERPQDGLAVQRLHGERAMESGTKPDPHLAAGTSSPIPKASTAGKLVVAALAVAALTGVSLMLAKSEKSPSDTDEDQS